jgi:hypothetical protein
VKRLLLGIVVAVLALVVPVRPAAAASIQPGDYMQTSVGGCTLGFLATAGGRTLFMSAAHCVDHVGEQVRLEDGSVLGHVVAMGNPDVNIQDWSLIEVSASRVGQTSGVVRGHSAPSGFVTSTTTSLGDLVDYSGHGIPFYVTDITREQRFGVLTEHTQNEWATIGPDTFGDSGGPVLHRGTGAALGLVSRLCIGLCTSMGPTVEGILPQAAARGFSLTLRTF